MKKIITIIFIVFAAFLISSCENDENKSDYVSTFSLIETGEYMGHCYLLVKKENNGETLSTEPVYDGKLAIDFITAKGYEEGELKNVIAGYSMDGREDYYSIKIVATRKISEVASTIDINGFNMYNISNKDNRNNNENVRKFSNGSITFRKDTEIVKNKTHNYAPCVKIEFYVGPEYINDVRCERYVQFIFVKVI